MSNIDKYAQFISQQKAKDDFGYQNPITEVSKTATAPNHKTDLSGHFIHVNGGYHKVTSHNAGDKTAMAQPVHKSYEGQSMSPRKVDLTKAKHVAGPDV